VRADDQFEHSVFINCPFDPDYASLLEAALFCVIYFGLTPRLANERLEAGETRLDKIIEMIRGSRYSIHDLSLCKAQQRNEIFRMNMPFEYGIDVGFRRSGLEPYNTKKFLIFENSQYDLKSALSDTAGQDVEFHQYNYELVIRKVRNFVRVEANINAPGPSRLISDYVTFQGWMTEKKLAEGHSEKDALALPTRERLDEMKIWIASGKPATFTAHAQSTGQRRQARRRRRRRQAREQGGAVS
jgi:hypothetical protein